MPGGAQVSKGLDFPPHVFQVSSVGPQQRGEVDDLTITQNETDRLEEESNLLQRSRSSSTY